MFNCLEKERRSVNLAVDSNLFQGGIQIFLVASFYNNCGMIDYRSDGLHN